MIINFNNLGDKILKQKITEIFEIALKETHNKQNITVGVTIVGKKTIRELNLEHRNIDKVTDVLSFPMLENVELKSPIMQDESVLTDLGDIVICKSRATLQAKEYGHSIQRELCFLSLHGFLHVLGYDHIKKEDELVMFPLQEKILNKAQMERKWNINLDISQFWADQMQEKAHS